MQRQTTQPVSPKFNLDGKRILYFARVTLFVIIVIGIVLMGILWLLTGATIYSSLSTVITSVATVLAISFFFIPDQPTPTQPIVPQPTSNTASVAPNDVQTESIAQSTGSRTSQPIFFPNIPLHDPNEFYGHNAARITLVHRTFTDSSSSIVGERKAGKTWLLKYLQLVAPSELGSNYCVVSISAKHSDCKTQTGFVQLALKALNVPSLDSGLEPLSQLSQAVRNLRQQGLHPVLCIDKFDAFASDKQEFDGSFFDGLRAMAQDDGLVLVIASILSLKELIGDLVGLTSPLFSIVQQISLSSFTEQEARKFMQEKSNKAVFTENESEFFFECSTRHYASGVPYWPPLRLQCVGQLLFGDKQGMQGHSLDDQLNKFHYRNGFERRLEECLNEHC